MTTPAAHRPPVHRTVEARPEDVWAVLADGWAYPSWVVGAARVRAVDAAWPAIGTSIDHSVGVWPFLLSDSTEVEDCEPGRMLLLRARGWPLGEAHVLLELRAEGDGCRVSLREDAVNGPGAVVPVPFRQAAIHPRNVESLRRLALLAERRDPSGLPHPGRAVSGG